jgi:PAS domain S-box-containing protein
MQLRLRTKLTLVITGLVLVVVAALSLAFVAQITVETLEQANEQAVFVTRQVFAQTRQALRDAPEQDVRPKSQSAGDLRDYVQRALEVHSGLHAQIQSVLAYSPNIDEVTIADEAGVAFLSSDARLPGQLVPRRPPLTELLSQNFFTQIKTIYGPPRNYEVSYGFTMGGRPFGDVRLRVTTAFLRNSMAPGLKRLEIFVLGALVFTLALAAAVSWATLRPLAAISEQLDRITAGEFDAGAAGAGGSGETGDELGQVSRKITKVGQQLRGVHEIFSTLRENMDQMMSGLEDGLLLFSRDARAVMVSPAAEKLLAAPGKQLLGRRASEIFPPGHALRAALVLDGEELGEVAAEAELETSAGRKRVRVSVQEIQENGERRGALMTLRDLDSIENISTQLQVSERLAALGRITAGVAHEVKNPLNSMRLWLENLKESLPEREGGAMAAVNVLDKEIDRLDTVVKRFLDFTRPTEMRLEATQLAGLLREVLQVAGPQLRKARIRTTETLAEDVPEVYADRALLKQAVLNLVLNAAEAMPSGGELRVGLQRRGEMAEITVNDSGQGIAAQHRQKIFQLFFTTRPGGSGIGLASTFRIVQLHNGSINFTSEEGCGTSFQIELPLAS